jgi:hypothetical protein
MNDDDEHFSREPEETPDTAGRYDLADRQALRRVAGLST